MKKPETPIRGNNLLQARPLRRSVRGSPAASRRRDSRRRPPGGAAATSMAFGRRWAMDGGAEVGPAPVWRATPRARAETLRAAPETVSGTGQRGGGEWGAGCGDGRQGAGAAAGGRALSPGARGGQPLTPSLSKIAPRRAAQPLRHQEGGGVGAGPHEIERRRRKLAKNGKKATRIFGVFGVFLPYFFRQRHCGTIQRYGGLREGLRGSLVAWARGVRGVAGGGQPAPRPPWVDRPVSD